MPTVYQIIDIKERRFLNKLKKKLKRKMIKEKLMSLSQEKGRHN